MSIRRGTGYELIHQGTQRDELADGKSRNGNGSQGSGCRVEHPIEDLIRSAAWLSDQEVVDAVMLMVADNQDGPADQRMKWIGDNGFECQKPGTMAPARTVGPATGIAMTLIQTAKLNGVDPMAWFSDALEPIVSG